MLKYRFAEPMALYLKSGGTSISVCFQPVYRVQTEIYLAVWLVDSSQLRRTR